MKEFFPSQMAHLARCALAFCTLLPTASAGERVRFNRDVRPILSGNCFYCHGPDEKTREADLRLDERASAITERDGFRAIVAGDPDASELLRRIISHDADEVMPPPKAKKPPLTTEQIDTLRRWIAEGAEYEGHWAFLAQSDAEPPTVESAGWVRNPIDQFVLARLEREGVTPSPEADRATLIRRIALDLTGLLPTPEEVKAFVEDPAQDAYARLVERLLASPHYGERWGRHWLDQARYADSNGYSIDSARAMWPYRDWVIKALNDDLPFDQFTVQQIAGDLLPTPTKSQLVATAFHRNTLINEEGGTKPEQFRVEAVIDRVNTTGAVWLGLTVGCAQCHTHKFDPITHREFYQMFAFFNQGEDVNSKGATVEVARGEVFGEPVAEAPLANQKTSAQRITQEEWEAQELARLEESGAESELLRALKIPSAMRGEAEKKATRAAYTKAIPKERAEKPRTDVNGDIADLMVMRDVAKPRPTHLLLRGDYTRPDEAGGELFPAGLSAVAPALPPTPSRTRLDLARWLVDPANPLTARVTMNRMWMRYFGRGIVETDEDFGTQGATPTHPELLDWLAREFIRQGWSMKAMHRLIATSATYRQSSQARPELATRDPRNLWLARQERVRVEAEIVRDLALSASGLLTPTIGGPSVHPPQPDGVYAFTQTNKKWPTATGPDRFRRALYTMFYRSSPHPLFATFDVPDLSTTCTRRTRSNTPLQALNVANDPAFLELAAGLAERIRREAPGAGLDQQIERAFLLCFSRPPAAPERKVLHDFAARGNDLTAIARVLFNTDNFITRE